MDLEDLDLGQIPAEDNNDQPPICLRMESLELSNIVAERRDRTSKMHRLNQLSRRQTDFGKQREVPKNNISDSEDSGEEEEKETKRVFNFRRNVSVMLSPMDHVYLNRMNLSNNDSLKTVINFRLSKEDLESPFLFKFFTRDISHEYLRQADDGSFLVRPSSRRGHYAITWVEEGKIKDKIVYNHFPGYGLTRSESSRHSTLSGLVAANKHFLREPLPRQEYSVTVFALDRRMRQIVDEIATKLRNNSQEVEHLEWQLSVLEDPAVYARLEDCERRTFIVCGGKQKIVLPECFDLTLAHCQSLCDALSKTNVLTRLSLKGFEGTGRRNCVSVLSDQVFVRLCRGIRHNTSLVELDVSFNEIRDEGAAAFASILLENVTLVCCDLSHNYITIVGLKSIVRSVRENMVIDELILDHQMTGMDMQGLPRISLDSTADYVIGALQNAFQRKVELLKKGFPFFAFISKQKAEELLYGREFVLYLNAGKPNTFQIAFKEAGEPVHRTVYRVNEGYSFSPSKDSSMVPSLCTYASWSYMSQDMNMDLSEFPQHIQANLSLCATLFHLWRVEDIEYGAQEHLMERVYPTLLYFTTAVQQTSRKKSTPLLTKSAGSGHLPGRRDSKTKGMFNGSL